MIESETVSRKISDKDLRSRWGRFVEEFVEESFRKLSRSATISHYAYVMYVRLFRCIEKDSRGFISLHLVTTDKRVKFDEIPANDNLMRSRQLVSRSRPQVATCRRNVIMEEGYYDANTRVVAFATFILGFILGTFILRFSALEIKRGIPSLIYYEEEESLENLNIFASRFISQHHLLAASFCYSVICHFVLVIRLLASSISMFNELLIWVIVQKWIFFKWIRILHQFYFGSR